MRHDEPSIDTLFTIREGGARNFLHPAVARGRFTRLRRVIFAALIALLVALPFVQINGQPGIWLDIGRRTFHILGATFGPTDGYLLFFLLTGFAFALVVGSALFGRVWCGYACPQTVFLEGVYRWIERRFEGDRFQQLKLDRAPLRDRLVRRGGKHFAFLVVSVLLAHLFIVYFVPAPELWRSIKAGPRHDFEVFAWAAAVTALLYFNFAWFREQMCIIVCPYGRLQSALGDPETIVVGYDENRGEPRGKRGQAKGDCVDCLRCVAVCPTGIDIRQGQQLECVGCAACIDACDEVMDKIHRPRGLIRYDSQNGLLGQPTKFLRPRLYVYVALAVAGLVALVATTSTRPGVPVTLVRQPGMPFNVDDDVIRNAFALRMANKSPQDAQLHVEVRLPEHASATVGYPQWTVVSGAQGMNPLFVAMPEDNYEGPFDILVVVTDEKGRRDEMRARFLGPRAKAHDDEHDHDNDHEHKEH